MNVEKKKVGRPKGYRVSEETKKQISNSLIRYYATMNESQRKKWERVNELKRLVWEKWKKEINNID